MFFVILITIVLSYYLIEQKNRVVVCTSIMGCAIAYIIISSFQFNIHKINTIKAIGSNEINKKEHHSYQSIQNCTNIYKLEKIEQDINIIPLKSDDITLTCELRQGNNSDIIIINKVE